jgi:hypothetical protein
MANRPCKPDNDMKRLWQTLLPGTPLPSCGVTDESAAEPDQRDDQAGAGIDKSQIGHSKTRS